MFPKCDQCDQCGVKITAITNRVNYGFCKRCHPGSSCAYYLPKTLCGPADAEAVAAELNRREDWRLLQHWQRVLARQEPGDELLQFSCEQPQGLSIQTTHGVLWRRADELLSVIPLDYESRSCGSQRRTRMRS